MPYNMGCRVQSLARGGKPSTSARAWFSAFFSARHSSWLVRARLARFNRAGTQDGGRKGGWKLARWRQRDHAGADGRNSQVFCDGKSHETSQPRHYDCVAALRGLQGLRHPGGGVGVGQLH